MKLKWNYLLIGGLLIAISFGLNQYIAPYMSGVGATVQMQDSVDSSAIGRASSDLWSWLPMMFSLAGLGVILYGIYKTAMEYQEAVEEEKGEPDVK